MVEREVAPVLQGRFAQYPFVTVTGPRQSGKTTLCRSAFPELAYANLEDPSQRLFAETDPRGFISSLGNSAIIDEIQHVPQLLSYLQVIADDAGRNSMYVLTGSEQFQLTESVTQSLAGRTALLQLLPFSLAERRRIGASDDTNEILFEGGYPRLLDQGLHPSEALADYLESYVERDVRRLGNVRQLTTFRRFMRLCAGRIGQLLNLNSLASDLGIRQSTARDWFTILEASFITHRLEPYWSNLRKRLVKTPKLYFYDTGLACYLLGISDPAQLAAHPLRGALFENLVVSEVIKSHYNRGDRPNLSFFRDSNGLECDLLEERGGAITAIEIKSGATVSRDYFGPLRRVAGLVPEIARSMVVYGGETKQTRHSVEVVPYAELTEALDPFDVQEEVDVFIRRYSRVEEEPLGGALELEQLDQAYEQLIGPTIEALNVVMEPIWRALFDRLDTEQYIIRVSPQFEEQSIGGRVSKEWETFREAYNSEREFRPYSDEQVKFERDWQMRSYAGRGATGFDLNLRLTWAFDAEGVTCSVELDGQPLPELALRTAYESIRTDSASSDRLVADLTKRLMRHIAERSAA